MPIDFNALMQDPQFVAGVGLLGTASPRNRGMLEAYNMLQQMEKRKMEQQEQEQMMQYRRAQTEQAKQHSKLYERQVADAERRSQLQQQNSQAAMEFIRRYAGGGALGVPAPQQQAAPQQAPQQQEQGVPSTSMGPMGPLSPLATQTPLSQMQAQPAPVDPVVSFFNSKILQQESGGQQFTPRGTPVTSPKGAIGIAQIMPTTGPEAAALAGLPWDANLLNSDAEYNRSLGEAYFRKQLEDFGTLPHAAAAYNAGPTRLNKAIQIATRAGNPNAWISFMPAETRKYVQLTTGYTGGMVPKQLQKSEFQPIPQPGAPSLEPHRAFQMAGAMMDVTSNPGGALSSLGKALEPSVVRPGSIIRHPTGQIEAVPDPIGERRAAAAEAGVQVERTKEQRLGQEQARTRDIEKAQSWRNVATTFSNLDMLAQKTSELINAPGVRRIYGAIGTLPDYPGSPASDARAMHKSVVSQLAKETLASIREASKTGGALGNVSDKDIELLETAVQNLGSAQSYNSAAKAMKEVIKYTFNLRNLASEAYEKAHGESPFGPDVPLGVRIAGFAKGTGETVYKDADGNLVTLGK